MERQEPKVERPGIEDTREAEGIGHTAEEKCRAVLSVWTERRKPGEVCRELGVAWSLLNPVAGAGNGGDALSLAATSSNDGEDMALNRVLRYCWSGRAREEDERWSGVWPASRGVRQARGTAGSCTLEKV